MDPKNNKHSDWDNYIEGSAKSMLGSIKLVGALGGLFLAYSSYTGLFPMSPTARIVYIIISLAVSAVSFYTLFRKK